MKKSVAVLFMVSIVLIFSISLVSANIFTDWLKDLFNIGEESDLEGELATLIGEENLVAYYPFDEDANDETGNYAGTIYGNPQFISGVDGSVLSALSFDGNDCVYLEGSSGTDSPLNIYDKDITISAWIKINGNGGTIVARAKPHYVTYWLNAETNKACVRIYNTRTARHIAICTNEILNQNTWYHITGVFDRVNNQGKVYVNGTLEAIDSMIDAPSGNDGLTKIGCRNDYNDMPFSGTIDEVKIWNYALSAQEVWDEYNLVIPSNQTCTDTDGGINYYVKGTATGLSFPDGGPASHTDYCWKEKFPTYTGAPRVGEMFCDGNGYVVKNDYYCPGDCQNGACIEGNGTTCTDSDVDAAHPDGINYAVKGTVTNNTASETDVCSGESVIEFYCMGSGAIDSTIINCAAEGANCIDGACVNQTAYCGDGTCSGASEERTINNNETITINFKGLSYTVSAIVTAFNEVRFTINGEMTSKLDRGDSYTLSNGELLYVTDIVYQAFVGGVQQASFFLGEDSRSCPADCSSSSCGNEIIEPGEVCDGTNLGEQTCESQGYDQGTISCCDGCATFDFSSCKNIDHQSCTDYDGGADYYTASNVTGATCFYPGPACPGDPQQGTGCGVGTALDKCNGDILTEMICTGNMTGSLEYDCSSEGKTCQNGACVGQPIPCTLTSAYWEIDTVTGGTSVQLNVEGTNCDGREISFEIWEDDGIFPNDYITTLSGTFDGTSWIAKYMGDQWGNPEYFFIARTEGSNPVSSGNLKVEPGSAQEFYVSGLGTGNHDGSSIENAFSLTEAIAYADSNTDIELIFLVGGGGQSKLTFEMPRTALMIWRRIPDYHATFNEIEINGASNIELDNLGILGSGVNNQTYGIHVRDGDHITIKNFVMIREVLTGISVYSSDNINIMNNNIYGVGSDQITVSGPSSNIFIEDNSIYYTNLVEGAHADGIQLYGGIGNITSVFIRNNNLNNLAGQGIFVEGTNDLTIEGNSFSTVTLMDIRVMGSHDGIITNNYIETFGGMSGILIDYNSCTNIQEYNNTIV